MLLNQLQRTHGNAVLVYTYCAGLFEECFGAQSKGTGLNELNLGYCFQAINGLFTFD